MVGDVNSDGYVANDDPVYLQQLIYNQVKYENLTENQKRIFDTYKDGSINVLDISMIQAYSSGKIDSLPVIP